MTRIAKPSRPLQKRYPDLEASDESGATGDQREDAKPPGIGGDAAGRGAQQPSGKGAARAPKGDPEPK